MPTPINALTEFARTFLDLLQKEDSQFYESIATKTIEEALPELNVYFNTGYQPESLLSDCIPTWSYLLGKKFPYE